MAVGDEMSKSKADFWSKASQRYDKAVEGALGGNIRPLINEKLRHEGHLGKVVEFGCGTGYFTKTLARQAENVVATDFSEDMVHIAQTRLEGLDNVEFKNENWQETSFADETFDAIFSGLVMPFVDDKVKVLKESYRILKPAGRVILADPNILLLKGLRKFQSLCRIIVAWRGNPPSTGRFQSVSELLDETDFTLASLDVIQDPSHPSITPVEYIKLLKSR